jgi:hypothetical protein
MYFMLELSWCFVATLASLVKSIECTYLSYLIYSMEKIVKFGVQTYEITIEI